MEWTIDEFLENTDTNGDPKLAFNRGKWLKERGRFSDAIKDFTESIILDRFNMHAFAERSLCYLALQSYDLSIVDITKAIELAGNDHKSKALFYEIRSRGYIKKGDTIQAFIDLNTSCDLFPSIAFEARAYLYLKQKSYYEALRDFNQMAVFQPNNGEFPFNIGFCYNKLGEKDKAIEYIKKAKELGYKRAEEILKQMGM